jgi:hypothetical protein
MTKIIHFIFFFCVNTSVSKGRDPNNPEFGRKIIKTRPKNCLPKNQIWILPNDSSFGETR